MKTLENCDNLFGKISPQIQKRIKRFINEPTADNWDDISGIIIKGNSTTTIWQAMVAYDPTFPNKGRTTDTEGNVIKEWERIPTPFEVLKAIKEFTKDKGKNKEYEYTR